MGRQSMQVVDGFKFSTAVQGFLPMNATETFPSDDELESLFVNNQDLGRISAYITRFNPIKVMKMAKMEIRHSAVLGWLLNPSETHGLGDHFLRAFLAQSLRGRSKGHPTSMDVIRSDLADAEVRIEWRNIDIYISSPSNGWVFIVENKISSRQHTNQLKRYFEREMDRLRPFHGMDVRHVLGVFLTLNEELPQHDAFAPISYEKIRLLLAGFLQSEAHSLSNEVRVFLGHYLEVIEELTGVSDKLFEMQELAVRLYAEHRKTIDFIVQHGQGSGFAIASKQVFGEKPVRLSIVNIDKDEYVFDAAKPRRVSFLPYSWYMALGGRDRTWKGCENWWAGFPVIAWLELVGGDSDPRVKLYAEVGPLEDFTLRKAIIDDIKAAHKHSSKISFRGDAAESERKYSKFLAENSTPVPDAFDHEKIASAMKSLLTNSKGTFEAVGLALMKFSKRESSES